MYGMLTTRQNLEFFAGAYGMSGKERQEAIRSMEEEFHLTPYMNAPAAHLPGGYKQRLSMACALLHSPDILFLDEPTSGADPLARRDFWTAHQRPGGKRRHHHQSRRTSWEKRNFAITCSS